MPLVEVNDFDALIDNRPVFDQAVKSKQEGYEKIIEMLKNDVYTGNLLDFSYHQIVKNQMNMMVQQYFLLLKSSKKPF